MLKKIKKKIKKNKKINVYQSIPNICDILHPGKKGKIKKQCKKDGLVAFNDAHCEWKKKCLTIIE